MMFFSETASIGMVAFLFSVFTTYWARSTHRDPWIWFFFGFLTPPLAGLVLLWKMAYDGPIKSHLNEKEIDDLIVNRKNPA